jgi:hypothetical protein
MFIDLVYQVKSLLGLNHGGTGNRFGLGRGSIFRATNGSGASLAVGSTVKRSTFPHAVVTPTTDTNERVMGITVGDMGNTDEIDEFTATPAAGIVAVQVSGVVAVRLGANVTAGQYGHAHATDGTAYSSTTQFGSFGRFLTSGTSGGKAKLLLTLGGVRDYPASAVVYSNSASGLAATDVQAAIDEHIDEHPETGPTFLEGEDDPSAGAGVAAALGAFYIRRYEAP